MSHYYRKNLRLSWMRKTQWSNSHLITVTLLAFLAGHFGLLAHKAIESPFIKYWVIEGPITYKRYPFGPKDHVGGLARPNKHDLKLTSPKFEDLLILVITYLLECFDLTFVVLY